MKNKIFTNKDILVQIANTHKTPSYVYSKQLIEHNFCTYQKAFSNTNHQICYAVKACGNLKILSLLASLGAGFDVVSIGELKRVILAGGDPEKTIFSGVGKRVDEIAFALEMGIEAFDIESIQELETIISVCEELKENASISIRLNPNVDAKTHPYISTGLKENKFGLTAEDAMKAYQMAKFSSWINIVGINMHIGSQITDAQALKEALNEQKKFIAQLKSELDIDLKHINVGGGLGVNYNDENVISINDWVKTIKDAYQDDDIKIIVEPGRSIIADAGILLTEVIYKKKRDDLNFVVVDAAMNDYARVALYQAYNYIENLSPNNDNKELCQVVGPVCESADCFAKNRMLDVEQGDILGICDVGAYGFAMASNYNTRERAAEILLIDNDNFELIRKRETFDDLIAQELIGEFFIDDSEED